MDKPKGGKGRTAPYETKQMRVPACLEDQVQELITRYRQWIGIRTIGVENPPQLLDQSPEVKPVDSFKAENLRLTKLVDSLRQELEAERNQLEFMRQAHSKLTAQKTSWTSEVVDQSRLQVELAQPETLQKQLDDLQHFNQELISHRDQLAEQLEQSRSQLAAPVTEQIALILVGALSLKANAGGAIKVQIQRALMLLKKRSPKIE